jgi:hypothetical protein
LCEEWEDIAALSPGASHLAFEMWDYYCPAASSFTSNGSIVSAHIW